MSAFSIGSFKNIWDVFLLFSIPIGGGIPAGVVLAQSRGVGWVTMTWVYFLSDIVLALYFEPLMHLMIRLSDRFHFLVRLRLAMKESTNKTIARFGANPGPFTLVILAFGVDPMSARAAALAQGHNFLAGWAFAIAGDMMFFAVTMASTIWLHDVLGDGTSAAVIIMIAMLVIPGLVRKIKHLISKK